MVLSQRACVRVYSFLFTLLTILLLMAGITMAATPKPRPRGQYTSTRVTQSIDESKLVILRATRARKRMRRMIAGLCPTPLAAIRKNRHQ